MDPDPALPQVRRCWEADVPTKNVPSSSASSSSVLLSASAAGAFDSNAGLIDMSPRAQSSSRRLSYALR